MSEDWAASGLAIQTSDRGSCRVVHLSGVLDIGVLGAQEAELMTLLSEAPHRCAVIDLSNVTFCDSSGLGVLVHAAKELRDRQGTLRLAEPQPPVAKVLLVSGISEVLPVHATVAEACEPQPNHG